MIYLLFFVFVTLYFVPSIFAVRRHHPRTGTIVLLNFLGITWPLALIWALTKPKQ
jgi:Superinfection immunity protein/Protein of unknown function (DUF3302)